MRRNRLAFRENGRENGFAAKTFWLPGGVRFLVPSTAKEDQYRKGSFPLGKRTTNFFWKDYGHNVPIGYNEGVAADTAADRKRRTNDEGFKQVRNGGMFKTVGAAKRRARQIVAGRNAVQS